MACSVTRRNWEACTSISCDGRNTRASAVRSRSLRTSWIVSFPTAPCGAAAGSYGHSRIIAAVPIHVRCPRAMWSQLISFPETRPKTRGETGRRLRPKMRVATPRPRTTAAKFGPPACSTRRGTTSCGLPKPSVPEDAFDDRGVGGSRPASARHRQPGPSRKSQDEAGGREQPRVGVKGCLHGMFLKPGRRSLPGELALAPLTGLSTSFPSCSTSAIAFGHCAEIQRRSSIA